MQIIIEIYFSEFVFPCMKKHSYYLNFFDKYIELHLKIKRTKAIWTRNTHLSILTLYKSNWIYISRKPKPFQIQESFTKIPERVYFHLIVTTSWNFHMKFVGSSSMKKFYKVISKHQSAHATDIFIRIISVSTFEVFTWKILNM